MCGFSYVLFWFNVHRPDFLYQVNACIIMHVFTCHMAGDFDRSRLSLTTVMETGSCGKAGCGQRVTVNDTVLL